MLLLRFGRINGRLNDKQVSEGELIGNITSAWTRAGQFERFGSPVCIEIETHGLGFRVHDPRLRVRIHGLGFTVQGIHI